MTLPDEWLKANREKGLGPNEICPGLTIDQHAESIAMWRLRDEPDAIYDDFFNTMRGSVAASLVGDLAVFQEFSD